ncbi:MAG: carbohydrate-binding domain-containing protein [Lachnospiraceae bacterium]|nr:carbohydrate-binding domain-containing protein [Lachnospiraceae bacterium]
MINKKFLSLLTVTVMTCALVLAGCSGGGDKPTENNKTSETNKQTTTKSENQDATEPGEDESETADQSDDTDSLYSKFDKDDKWDETDTFIELSKGDVIINEPGTYVLSGTLADGQVNINVDATEKVQLVLNGVDITCKDSAPIYVVNADKVVITLAEGTTNVLTDGGNADTSDASGCINSKDDLTINGTGKLIVKGKVKNGIHCNNDLRIMSGTIEISAVDNGIKAKDSLAIKSGTIKIDANDAIKVTDKDDETKGTFYMDGGDVTLTAIDDGLVATVSIKVTGGKLTIVALDKATNCDGTEEIADGCLVKR